MTGKYCYFHKQSDLTEERYMSVETYTFMLSLR